MRIGTLVGLVIAIVIATATWQWRTAQAVNRLTHEIESVEPRLAAGEQRVVAAAVRAESGMITAVRTSFDSMAANRLKRYRLALDSVSRAVQTQSELLAEVEVASARARASLPGMVTLDSLNEYYVSRSRGTSLTESFYTSRGSIGFVARNFDFRYVPSTGRLASLRIGKTGDASNRAELIQAWLDEAARAKVKLGYVRQYRRTRPSDYGEYTETLYTRGDLYFKTYYRYDRVQGTYDRYSHQYTYYVENGSTSRREQFELEQYNQKLGS